LAPIGWTKKWNPSEDDVTYFGVAWHNTQVGGPGSQLYSGINLNSYLQKFPNGKYAAPGPGMDRGQVNPHGGARARAQEWCKRWIYESHADC